MDLKLTQLKFNLVSSTDVGSSIISRVILTHPDRDQVLKQELKSCLVNIEIFLEGEGFSGNSTNYCFCKGFMSHFCQDTELSVPDLC